MTYKCLLVLFQPGSGCLPQSWPQTEPKQRPGNSAHSPSLTPEALPSSLPLSFPGHGKKPRSEQHGWVQDRGEKKERWMERKEKMAKDLGDIFKAQMLRLSSTFSGEGWWMWRGCVCVESGVRIGCKGTGDTFVSPVCQLREGAGGQPGWCCAHSLAFYFLWWRFKS